MSSKFDLSFTPPVMNAAGFMGFAPDAHGSLDLAHLGAFVTNPLSLEPRSPAAGTRFIPFSGGFLLHSGHPNPGLRLILRRFTARWRRSPLPVWVHLLVQTPQEATAMVRRLELLDGVGGFELGLPPGIDPAYAHALIQAARSELPLVVKIPIDQVEEMSGIAADAGADAISLAARRGVLPDEDGKLVQGRLYGPALFPQALLAVKTSVACGIPVIGGGGVYSAWQAQIMLACGAAAVQLDGVLWKGGWSQIEAPGMGSRV
jgi:dihydroorotate dehydrogenase (NAD+) catalytic subunit